MDNPIEGGILEVGVVKGEVIINHPDLQPDENGVGHIVFSPNQARALAQTLFKQAAIAENPPQTPFDRSLCRSYEAPVSVGPGNFIILVGTKENVEAHLNFIRVARETVERGR